MEDQITIPATNGHSVAAESKGDNFDIVVLKFADSKVPVFKEIPSKDYILYGERNDYPEYLTYQYNKCGKHRAIINGKCNYIIGEGLEGVGGWSSGKTENGLPVPADQVNNEGETMLDVLKKSCKDIEIYGGFRWFVTWGPTGNIVDIKHAAYSKFRTAKPVQIKDKDGNLIAESGHGYIHKEKWFDEAGRPNNKEHGKFYPEFDPEAKDKTVQVFAYNEYAPGSDWYPLPGYIGSANYIDIDIEISKFHLSAIRNGMMPSKLIQFYTGEPTDDKKKEIERRWKDKFAGSENAGRFVLVFNTTKDKQVDINDLSFNELDKQFDLLSKTVQQEVFTGHQVVSPMLFGIKTEGQLGGNTELRTAYEIFINTYAKPKQHDLERIVNYFGKLMGKGDGYRFRQLDPVGLIFDVKDFIDDIPKEFALEKLGVPKGYITPSVLPAGSTGLPSPAQQATNENVRNLTAKQNEQMMRILRQHARGKLSKEQAALLLKTGIGFSDEEIEVLLYLPSEEEDAAEVGKFSSDVQNVEDEVIQMFNSCGDLRKDFHIIKTKRVAYSSDTEAMAEELSFYSRLGFKGAKVTITEANILDLISKDKRITPEVIAKTLDTSTEYVTSKIASMVDRGLLKTSQQSIGDDTIIERELVKPLKDLDAPPPKDIETTEILIKYSYEGPKDDRNRPFCAKLLALDRLYSRAEIESISQRLGYSVWDRRGGWWTKPNGDHSPSCRHRWVSNVVVRKKKGGVK